MLKFFKYIVLSIFLLLVFEFGCPLFKIFGITCPTCGVTRAWIFLLRGSIIQSLKINPLYIPLTILFMRIIYSDFRKCKLKRIEIVIYLFITVLAFVFNIYRILNGL